MTHGHYDGEMGFFVQTQYLLDNNKKKKGEGGICTQPCVTTLGLCLLASSIDHQTYTEVSLYVVYSCAVMCVTTPSSWYEKKKTAKKRMHLLDVYVCPDLIYKRRIAIINY